LAKLNKSRIKLGILTSGKIFCLDNQSPQEREVFYNALSMAKWRFEENIAELNKPVDKERWGMSPQTVNAYYNPSNNEIVFPAAILQPFLQLSS
jgi:predicted metalloendopeptidase